MQAIHAIEGIALRFSIIISGIVALIAFTAPQLMMKIFTSDQELISIGSSYLRIMGITYLCWGITEIYLAILRSIGRVTISMALNMLAFILNIILNATFILGFSAHRAGGYRCCHCNCCFQTDRTGSMRDRFFPEQRC